MGLAKYVPRDEFSEEFYEWSDVRGCIVKEFGRERGWWAYHLGGPPTAHPFRRSTFKNSSVDRGIICHRANLTRATNSPMGDIGKRTENL